MLQALADFGRLRSQAGLQSGHVQFGGREQGAEFIVQFAGEVAALFFAHQLQVCGQFGQRSGALAHLALQQVAFLLQHFLLLLAREIERGGLAQVQVERQQAGHRHRGDADA